MQHSSTTALWAVPKTLRDQNIVEKPARTVVLCRSNGSTPDFVAGEAKANELGFGAFRPDEFALRSDQARNVILMQSPHSLQTMAFEAAAEVWLENHKDEIGPRTYNDYRFYIRTLCKYFGPKEGGVPGMLLSQIHIGHIVEYRKGRQKTAGAWCINHEITTLKQIMEMADLWDIIAKHYKPMKAESTRQPYVPTADEEERFFRVVAKAVWSGQKPGWEPAYLACSLTNNTSAYGCELRFLQLRHIFLDHIPPKIHIPDDKVKNEFRARVIPLNPVALKQIVRLVDRAKAMGAYKPDHHLFPFRIKKGEYDLNRPASAFFIRSAFRSMCKATGMKLQPKDFRNLIITKMFESGAPDETIISIAGHGAIKMSRYYSRIRLKAKEDVLNKISPASTGKRKDVENAS